MTNEILTLPGIKIVLTDREKKSIFSGSYQKFISLIKLKNSPGNGFFNGVPDQIHVNRPLFVEFREVDEVNMAVKGNRYRFRFFQIRYLFN